jgi:hypothetical protein
VKKLSLCLLIVISVLAVSCIKDHTNMNLTKVNPIKIDTAGVPISFVVFQLDTVKLAPTVTKEGFNPDHLKYKWTMNAFQGYERIIGTEKSLVGVVTEAPSSTPYVLILTVTDTTTNLKAFFTWNVTVSPRFGEGLIVADTKDEASSDLNLIMAYNFTTSFLDDNVTKIYRDLYSSSNGTKITGMVKGVSYMNYQNNRVLTCLTDNAMIRVNPISYKFTTKDNDNFLVAPETISPSFIQSVQTNNAHEYIINNGRVHGRFGNNLQFWYPYLLDNTGYTCQKLCGLQSPSGNGGVLYDEKNNRFLMLPTITSAAAPLVPFPAVDNSNPAPAFDPRNMGNKTCLNLEEGYNQKVFAVMKTRDMAQYYVYQVTAVNPVNGKMGYSLHDLSNNPDIGLSKYYTCSNQENVLFYATDTKVYSTTLLVGGATNTNLRYTVSSGEKITGMKMYIKGGKMYLPSLSAPDDWSQRRTMASANRLLLLSMYNESTKEGKIIAIPLETLGVGGLSTNPLYIKTYGGFGRITAFNFQAP